MILDHLGNENSFKNEDDFKNKGDRKNQENRKNEDKLKDEDDLRFTIKITVTVDKNGRIFYLSIHFKPLKGL